MTQFLPLPRKKTMALPLLLLFLMFPLMLKGITNSAGEAGEIPCESLAQHLEIIPVAVSCSDNTDGKIEILLNNINLSSISLSAGCEGVKSEIPGSARNQGAVYSNLAAGFYQVTIKTKEGCELKECLEIESPAPITFTLTEHPLSCTQSTASITIEANGGTPPYTLTNAENSESIEFENTHAFENPIPGNHQWWLSDAAGCGSLPIEFEVAEGVTPLQGWLTEIHAPDCHNPENGGFEIFVEGGIAPYEFSMEGAFFDNIFSASTMAPGVYFFTATDQNNCSLTIEVEIPNPDQPEIIATEIINADEGEENGQIWVNIQGGSSPYQISLQAGCQGEGQLKNLEYIKSGSHIFWGLRAGVYTIRVTDQDACMANLCVEVKTKESSKTTEQTTPVRNLQGQNPAAVRVFPNPFSQHTSFEFSSDQQTEASLEIFNLVGERVAVVFKGNLMPGEKQRQRFSSGDLPNGVYFYRLQIGQKLYYDKLILSR